MVDVKAFSAQCRQEDAAFQQHLLETQRIVLRQRWHLVLVAGLLLCNLLQIAQLVLTHPTLVRSALFARGWMAPLPNESNQRPAKSAGNFPAMSDEQANVLCVALVVSLLCTGWAALLQAQLCQRRLWESQNEFDIYWQSRLRIREELNRHQRFR